MKYLLFLVLVMAAQAQAVESKKAFDPSDPAIWHEKPGRVDPRDVPEDEQPCRIFQASVCPDAYDSQTDIQREKQRRHDKWLNNQAEKNGYR